MKRLRLPLSEEERMSLKAGEPVLLSGEIYTARDAAHKKLHELIAQGKELPVNLEGATIYYVGPTPAKEGQAIGSAGPTTSGRMDPYAPELLDLGLKGMIGKGRRNQAVKDAIIRNKAVYFVAVGGAGALAARCIRDLQVIAFEDLGCESVKRLYIEDFPLVVCNDAHGGDLFSQGRAAYAG